MGYSKNLAYKWQLFLESEDIEYDFDSEKGRFIIPDIIMHNKLKSVAMCIMCDESDFRIMCGFDQSVPQQNRDEMAILMTRINAYLYFGSFYLDISNGNMGFSYAVDFEGGIASTKMLENALGIVLAGVNNWADAIMDVCEGRLRGTTAYLKYNKP